MAGFDDLIDQALPYLAVEHIQATAGTTWQWAYYLTDGTGAAVDMTSGYTATMSIQVKDGAEVIAATVTFPTSGTIKCVATPAATAAVAAGQYHHELTVTRTSDSAKIVAVGAGDSKFNVKAKVS